MTPSNVNRPFLSLKEPAGIVVEKVPTWTVATLAFIHTDIAQPYDSYTLKFRLGKGVLTETSTHNDEGFPWTTLHGVENNDIRYRDSLAQDRAGDERLHVRIPCRFHLIDLIDCLY